MPTDTPKLPFKYDIFSGTYTARVWGNGWLGLFRARLWTPAGCRTVWHVSFLKYFMIGAAFPPAFYGPDNPKSAEQAIGEMSNGR